MKAIPAGPQKSYQEVETDNEEYGLAVDIIGVPFGGPDYLGGKDLDGEYFSPNTDIGPLKTAVAFFDHALDDEIFGDEDLGIAERIGKTDEGWVYRVLVKRRHQYFDVLKRLAQENALMASSSPFRNRARKNAKGEITHWPVVEMSLTMNPANPKAVQIAHELLGVDTMPAKKKTADVVIVDDTQDEGDAAEQKTTTLTDAINSAIEDAVEETAADAKTTDLDTENDAANDVASMFKSIMDRISAIEAKIGDQDKAIGDFRQDVREALPAMASSLAKSFLGRTDTRSRQERDAETPAPGKAKSSSPVSTTVGKLPANAPGNW